VDIANQSINLFRSRSQVTSALSDPRKIGWQSPVRLGNGGFSKRIIATQKDNEVAGFEKKLFWRG